MSVYVEMYNIFVLVKYLTISADTMFDFLVNFEMKKNVSFRLHFGQ